MTNPVEMIDAECALQTEQSLVSAAEVGTNRKGFEVEFLDDEWAREFDRRLAAWESESPSSVPMPESVKQQ